MSDYNDCPECQYTENMNKACDLLRKAVEANFYYLMFNVKGGLCNNEGLLEKEKAEKEFNEFIELHPELKYADVIVIC